MRIIKNSSQRGFAQLIVVILIIFGLGASVYLTRFNNAYAVTVSTYDLGVGYFSQNNAGVTPDMAWSKATESAHVASIQKHWAESYNSASQDYINAVATDVNVARSKGLKIYLAMEVLSGDRKTVVLPNALQEQSSGFNNSTIQNYYIDLVKNTANIYHPDYFIINIEINMYKQYDLKDYNAYKSKVYSKAYNAIKQVSPQTQVAVSLVYSDYNNANCIDNSDLAQFRGYVADFNNRTNKEDMLGVSTYPFCYLNPSNIPQNFIDQIAGFYSSIPLFISETGWISQSFSVVNSDPQIQAAYIDKLSEMVEYARSNGKNINSINYISIVDMDDNYCALVQSVAPQNGWLCYLSLMYPDFTEKPAFGKMRDWKNRL